MIYKTPCSFCNTLIDNNSLYCPFCGRGHPCDNAVNEAEDTIAEELNKIYNSVVRDKYC